MLNRETTKEKRDFKDFIAEMERAEQRLKTALPPTINMIEIYAFILSLIGEKNSKEDHDSRIQKLANHCFVTNLDAGLVSAINDLIKIKQAWMLSFRNGINSLDNAMFVKEIWAESWRVFDMLANPLGLWYESKDPIVFRISDRLTNKLRGELTKVENLPTRHILLDTLQSSLREQEASMNRRKLLPNERPAIAYTIKQTVETPQPEQTVVEAPTAVKKSVANDVIVRAVTPEMFESLERRVASLEQAATPVVVVAPSEPVNVTTVSDEDDRTSKLEAENKRLKLQLERRNAEVESLNAQIGLMNGELEVTREQIDRTYGTAIQELLASINQYGHELDLLYVMSEKNALTASDLQPVLKNLFSSLKLFGIQPFDENRLGEQVEVTQEMLESYRVSGVTLSQTGVVSAPGWKFGSRIIFMPLISTKKL
jgi:hypothetical protein